MVMAGAYLAKLVLDLLGSSQDNYSVVSRFGPLSLEMQRVHPSLVIAQWGKRSRELMLY